MLRGLAVVSWLIFSSIPVSSPACAAEPVDRPTTYDETIARLAKAHGVPESFVHRVVKRESRYRPGAISRRCFGLMQLKPATARSMGYQGSPTGLLDPEVNLTYGIPYLANAYKIAEGDPDLAVKLYSAGYYQTAKRKNMLGELRTALSEPLVPETEVALDPPTSVPEPAQEPSPFGTLLSFLGEPATSSVPVPLPPPAPER